MARKGWDSLSDGYRKRLQRAGISRSDYGNGVALAPARGHGKTPEHPNAPISRKKYPEYFDKRAELIKKFQEKKERLWNRWTREYRSNGRVRFDYKNSFDNVRDYVGSLKLLQWAIDADEDDLIDALRRDATTYKFVGYH